MYVIFPRSLTFLPHLPCLRFLTQDKELRDIRNEMQDREADLDTLRKAGRNLRERLDEKDIETRDIMERVRNVNQVGFCGFKHPDYPFRFMRVARIAPVVVLGLCEKSSILMTLLCGDPAVNWASQEHGSVTIRD